MSKLPLKYVRKIISTTEVFWPKFALEVYANDHIYPKGIHKRSYLPMKYAQRIIVDKGSYLTINILMVKGEYDILCTLQEHICDKKILYRKI